MFFVVGLLDLVILIIIRDLCYVWIVYIYKRYFKIYGIIYELYYYSVEF